MRKVICFLLAAGIASTSFSQSRTMAPVHMRDKSTKMKNAVIETTNFNHTTLTSTPLWQPDETVVGSTIYDLQTNASMQNRMVMFDDGSACVTWTKGMFPSSFNDRGTGYNYFDGNNWVAGTTTILENEKAGWPCMDKFGSNGEIVVSHTVNGLFVSKRNTKGTGNWEQFKFYGPPGNTSLLWPRVATGGTDNTIIHLIALTRPVVNGGSLYSGMDGALLYSRSGDGGSTWQSENVLLPEINSNFSNGFRADTYVLKVHNNIVAFIAGDPWNDLVLMKSDDHGETWIKTIVWECPYPNWTGGITDTFYCPDGSHSLAIDQSGKVYTAFGINRAFMDGSGEKHWFPLVGGIVFWKEGRPLFSSNLNALNPFGHPDSELIDDYSLIGWEQDVNNNGELDILGNPGLYYVGSSSMPQLTFGSYNNIILVYSAVTETYNNGIQDYRHFWARMSDGFGEWWGSFYHMTAGLNYIYDEFVFPSLAKADYLIPTGWKFDLLYQSDNEPGMAIMGDLDPYIDNQIRCTLPITVGIMESKASNPLLSVAQNSPNPFTERSVINVSLSRPADLYLEVVTLTGKKMISRNIGSAQAGSNRITIERGNLSQGIYFYTVRAGSESSTKKMIVR